MYGSSECSVHVEDTVCSSKSTVDKLSLYIKEKYGSSSDNPVEYIMDKLGIKTESELLENPQIKAYLGSDTVRREKDERFNPIGPRDNTNLLSNFNIDDNLEQWAKWSLKVFRKKFYHVKFHMIDFKSAGGELNRLDMVNLVREYDCFACVFNTDVSSGNGKHWFCIYGDFAHKKTAEDPVVFEFFNSSGNYPMPQITEWLESTIIRLQRAGIESKWIKVCDFALQKSRTECGVWCLIYIRSRLEGRPPKWICRLTDEQIIRAREDLFRKA